MIADRAYHAVTNTIKSLAESIPPIRYMVLPIKDETRPAIKAAGTLFSESEYHGAVPLKEWRKALSETGHDPSITIKSREIGNYLEQEKRSQVFIFPIRWCKVYEKPPQRNRN